MGLLDRLLEGRIEALVAGRRDALEGGLLGVLSGAEWLVGSKNPRPFGLAILMWERSSRDQTDWINGSEPERR
jgi:hypothetical protein